MSIFRKRQVQTLSAWLEIATRKITDASKERIRLEIEAHYAEAVESHREDGLSEVDAQTKALTELGDAKAAAGRFRKRHLTEWEDQVLKNSEKMARSIWWLAMCYFMFGQFAYDQLPLRRHALTHYHYPSFCLSLEFLVMIALPTLCFALARFARTKPNKHLLLLQSMNGFLPGIFLNELFTTGLSRFEVCFDGFCLLALLFSFLLQLRIWIKLGRTLNQKPILG